MKRLKQMYPLSVYDSYVQQKQISTRRSCMYSTVGMQYDHPDEYAKMVAIRPQVYSKSAELPPEKMNGRSFSEMFMLGKVDYGTRPRKQLREERLLQSAMLYIEAFEARNAELRRTAK